MHFKALCMFTSTKENIVFTYMVLIVKYLVRTNSFFILIYQNLPHDAYALLAVPSPIGGVLVICANSVHYHSQVR